MIEFDGQIPTARFIDIQTRLPRDPTPKQPSNSCRQPVTPGDFNGSRETETLETFARARSQRSSRRNVRRVCDTSCREEPGVCPAPLRGRSI